MSDTLDTYRPSGKFSLSGVVLSLGAALAAGLPLGLAYGYLLNWIPFVYINMLITVAYGGLFGWITMSIMKAARVRHPGIAAVCGTATGLIALYFDWNGHIHALFEDAAWFYPPDQILGAMAWLYEHGSWGMKDGGNVTGIFLGIVWVAEAACIVLPAAWLPYVFVRDTPYCEKSRCWLDEEKKIDTLEPFTDASQLARLKSGDIMPVVDAKPRAEGAPAYSRLLLKRSAKCPVFCTLRVQDISISFDKKGNASERVTDHTGDLILPASMFDLVVKFEEFKPTTPAAGPVPVPPA